MDNKEILYEISLKYNTLKMYENTLEQMRNNGTCGSESYNRLMEEKESVENEFNNLLQQKENLFVKEVTEHSKNRYSLDKGQKRIKPLIFFNKVPTLDEERQRINNEVKDKKPCFADVQEKISESKWITRSNFIVRFPLDTINIDEWRVAYFLYTKNTENGGDIHVGVNDFSEKDENGKYNILSAIIDELYANRNKTIGSIMLDVVGNNGELLYRILFNDCYFISAEPDSFAYGENDLMRFSMHFLYNNLKLIPPTNEAAN